MPATVIVNGQTVVHKESGGTAVSTDVCNTPIGSSVVPVPYTNVARSSDAANGSSRVSMDGNPVMLKDSFFSTSYGDEPGSCGGVASGVTRGKAKFITYSSDVFVEGRPVCRRLDLMVSNLSGTGNTPPAALNQPNIEAEVTEAVIHRISFALLFDAPHVVSGRVSQPLFETGHSVKGAEEHRHEGGSYPGASHPCRTAGEYELHFDRFGLKRKSLSRKDLP